MKLSRVPILVSKDFNIILWGHEKYNVCFHVLSWFIYVDNILASTTIPLGRQ